MSSGVGRGGLQGSASRGRAQGGASASTPSPLSSSVVRQRELRQRVDKDVAAMTENFAKMMSTAKIHDTLLRNAQEGFQASVHAAKLVQAAESLLKLVGELKQHALFSNPAALNNLVEQHKRGFELATQEASQVVDFVAEDAMQAMSEVEELRYSSGVCIETNGNWEETSS